MQELELPGYGQDKKAMQYLSGLLEMINSYNEGSTGLVALHVEGNGYCLVGEVQS